MSSPDRLSSGGQVDLRRVLTVMDRVHSAALEQESRASVPSGASMMPSSMSRPSYKPPHRLPSGAYVSSSLQYHLPTTRRFPPGAVRPGGGGGAMSPLTDNSIDPAGRTARPASVSPSSHSPTEAQHRQRQQHHQHRQQQSDASFFQPSSTSTSTSPPTASPINHRAGLRATMSSPSLLRPSLPSVTPEQHDTALALAMQISASSELPVTPIAGRTTMALGHTRPSTTSPTARRRVGSVGGAGVGVGSGGGGAGSGGGSSWATRSGDVSFLSDRPGHGMHLSRTAQVDLHKTPPTLIPKEHHVLEHASSVPAADPDGWEAVGPRQYVRTLFPSLRPSGRHEARLLTQLLNQFLEQFEEVKDEMEPRDLVKESQRIHSVCLFEIVRQVSVHCIERGVLLKRVWEGYGSLFEALWETTQRLIDALKRHYEDLISKLKTELEALLARVRELEDLIAAKDAELARLRKQVAEMEGNLMTDEVRDRLRRLEDENARLLAELMKARKALQELVDKLAFYQAEAEKWKAQLAEALAKIKQLEKDKAALAALVKRLQAEVASLQASIAKLKEENAGLRDKIADMESALAQLKAQLARAIRALADAKNGNSGPVKAVVDTADVECQTDAIVAESESDDDVPVAAKKKKKKKRLALNKKASPWPLTNALKSIQLIYSDKIKADAVDDACNNDRQNMQEYVVDWFKNQYGTGPMHVEAQSKFAATLTKFRATNAYCAQFGRLWGVFDEQDEATCDYYLSVLGPILESKSVSDQANVLPTKGNLGSMVKIKWLVDPSSGFIWKRFGPVMLGKYVSSFAARVEAAGERFGPKGLKYIDQERLMGIVMDEHAQMMRRLMASLANLFVAGDTNSDGILDMDEFTAIVRYVDVTASSELIETMHKQALTEGSETMEPDDFVRVCIDNNLLATAEAKKRLHTPYDEEKSLEEQFEALAAKWGAQADDVASRIDRVESEDDKEGLEDRVAHLKDVLEAGEELEVAWMAYRLMMGTVVAMTAQSTAADKTMMTAMKAKAWLKRSKAGKETKEGGGGGGDGAGAGAGAGGGGGFMAAFRKAQGGDDDKASAALSMFG